MKFRVGDIVKPRPEWIGDPNEVPSGRVREVAVWGKDGSLYVDGDHRAFAAYVFEIDQSAAGPLFGGAE